MTPVAGVIFDLFDTLVPFSETQWEELSNEMARSLLPHEPERFVQEWRAWTGARMRGDLEAVLRNVCATLAISPSPSAVTAALLSNRSRHADWLAHPRPDARVVLGELRRRGLRTGLVSNCSSSVPGSWPASPLGGLIDCAVFSCAEGVAKPDPAIYLRALDRLGLAASACLYIDDSARALEGAAAVGLQAIQIVPDGAVESSWTGPTVTTLTEVLELAGGAEG